MNLSERKQRACEARVSVKPGVERSGTPGIEHIKNNQPAKRVTALGGKQCRVLRDLKANASGWMHDVFLELKDFSWQRGYAAFTVSQSNVEEVRHYILRQKEHHAKLSFRDEFIQFLKANGIECDERYI